MKISKNKIDVKLLKKILTMKSSKKTKKFFGKRTKAFSPQPRIMPALSTTFTSPLKKAESFKVKSQEASDVVSPNALMIKKRLEDMFEDCTTPQREIIAKVKHITYNAKTSRFRGLGSSMALHRKIHMNRRLKMVSRHFHSIP